MNRLPLSKEPYDQSSLVKMAYGDSLILAIASAFLGAASAEIRPESIILGSIGLVFSYLFISDYRSSNEISILRKNIRWFNAYSIVTYASVALVGFFIHFEMVKSIAIVGLFPVIINLGIVRPVITVKIYKKNYTRLFGVIDA